MFNCRAIILINSAAALDVHDYDQRSLKQHANESSRYGDKGPINGTFCYGGLASTASWMLTFVHDPQDPLFC